MPKPQRTNILIKIPVKDFQIELAPIKADLNLLKWMIGALIAMTIANFDGLVKSPYRPSTSSGRTDFNSVSY
jgi:hypothetical protein